MLKSIHESFLQIPSTAIGFFLALFLNSIVERWRDRKSFQSMLRAIESEAKANDAILTESFIRFFKNGLVLRQFATDTVSQYLANPVFLEHVDPSVLAALHRYVRNINLANSYREKAEALRLREKDVDWLDSLIPFWEENLGACKTDIEFAQNIGSSR